ncbi:HNH endonuclease [Rhodospirillum rubrum]|uniref:HNH endonuclease n=1 Tax=Rhodospirillum rubrum TaxID=1085 RepID=UPI00190469FD|nr:HNH endonuclease [Rhodospirillum rubrum]
MKPWAKKFYNSKAWKECRASYIPKVFGLCEHCSRPGYILDHIKELTPENINDPRITLNHNNLQFLCLECHNTKTFAIYSPTMQGLMFDEEGNLVQRGERL